ncbi:MFS transporter, partial [Streptomyces erythrochromogenes]
MSATIPAQTLPDDAGRRWPLRLWGVLGVLCLVLFLNSLDGSIVGVALPSIGHDLGMGPESLQWIVNGYFLGYGGLLLLGGRAAD